MGHIQAHTLTNTFFITQAYKRHIKCGIYQTPETKQEKWPEFSTPAAIYSHSYLFQRRFQYWKNKFLHAKIYVFTSEKYASIT